MEIWYNDLIESRKNFEGDIIELVSDPTNKQRLLNTIEMAKECRDERYMENVDNMIMSIPKLNQQVYPTVLLCAPTGSGKSMIGYNLGSEKSPSLFINYANHHSFANALHSPFEKLSEAIHKAIIYDLHEIQNRDTWFNDDSVDIPNLEESKTTSKYRTVGIICHLFESLLEIKAKTGEENWLKVQNQISSTPQPEFTIEEGRMFLKELSEVYGIDRPFVLFVDACEIVVPYGTYILVAAPAFFLFLRNILGMLQTVAIFSGRDESMGKYKLPLPSPKPENDKVDAIIAAVISDTPAYNLTRFEKRAKDILKRSAGHPIISDIITFLRAVRLRENPFIIELVLNYIESHEPDSDSESFLQRILEFAFEAFDKRNSFTDEFSMSQFLYMSAFCLSAERVNQSSTMSAKSVTFFKQEDDKIINYHFGHLDIT